MEILYSVTVDNIDGTPLTIPVVSIPRYIDGVRNYIKDKKARGKYVDEIAYAAFIARLKFYTA